jgi:hypothetical protein
MKRFERVKMILEEAVGGQTILMHGNFWRELTLEQFKVKKVYGKKLVESGNAEESNLIKALEGRAPFGSDTGASGATIRRMPAGLPPAAPVKILFIRKWIDDGCPDEEETNVEWATDLPVVDATKDEKIVELLKVPAAEHDLEWLKDALQSALKLELSTLPPYLCALWSIDEDKPNATYPYNSIKQIVVDEMRHMGLVCNMLTTLGFTPIMNTPDTVPKYPGPLPGGVNPRLIASLRKLSEQQLEKFMEIEKPNHPPLMPVEPLGEEFDTIGEFYDAILEAFEKLPTAAYKKERQITGGGLFKISDFSKAKHAIVDIIKKQGEGTKQSPEDEENLAEPDLAHYYRFRELFWKRRFVKNAAGNWVNGADVLFPTVYDMADIPAGGYPESRAFDELYTELLNSLQKTWENGDNAEFGNAYGLMTMLKGEAKILMQTQIDPNNRSKGCFGPSFLLIDGV